MKQHYAILFLFTLNIFGFSTLKAQQITMQNGYFEQCGGGFLDSGAGGASYTDNENFTLTICPDVPGDVVGVDFILFNLNTTDTDPSPNNNNQDRLIAYDGNSTAAPSLGTFTGNSLQGVFVSASPFNTTGCLTFRFISNNAGVGDWAGTITCETPCDRPTAVGSDNAPANRRICIGDVVTFNGSGSFPGAGFNIASYLWDFADGTTANTAIASHSWDEPGEYIVELYLLDNNGCASTNRISLQILVATLPDWDPFPESTSICLGESVSWAVDPNEFEVTWTAGDPSQYTPVDDILADVVGACYEFPLEIAGFAPGQTLTDINDLFSIDIDIYHTFLFDLAIFIECPNGNQVVLHQQMQQPSGGNVGSNGTDLGAPGSQTTWNYGWTPQATQTWSQVATSGANNSLPAGDYMALQPLSGLVGCDLNGTWTLSICDLWGGDAGYLGGWGLSINPALIPDVTEFTPQIGLGSDSSYWAGPFIVNTSANGNNITITPSQVGTFDYTYTVINNHGCEHDSTITITVTPGPVADAGPDLVICDEPGQLEGTVSGLPQPEPNCVYTIQMFDTFGDGWNGFSVNVIQNGISLGTFTFNTGTQSTATFTVNHGATIQLNTVAGTWPTEVSYNILNSVGGIFFSDAGTQVSGTPILVGNNIFTGTADCQPGVPDYIYQWSPVTGLSDPTIPNPTVMVDQTTTYTLTAYEAGHPLCGSSDQVVVSIPPEVDPGLDTELTLCYNEPTFNMTDALNGTPVNNGVWTNAGGNVVPVDFSPFDYPAGGTFIFTYTTTFQTCVKQSQLTITILEAGNAACCQTFADAGQDEVVCDLTTQLTALPVLGTGYWSGPAWVQFADINNPTTTIIAEAPGGIAELIWMDDNGFLCAETDTVEIVFSVPMNVEIFSIPATCVDTCNAVAVAQLTGGLGAMNYQWSGGESTNLPFNQMGLCNGPLTVDIEDEYGCTATFTTIVEELPRPVIENIGVFAATCVGLCDGRVVITAPQATTFSFNGGLTFGSEFVNDSLCPGMIQIEVRNDLNCPNFGTALIEEPVPVVANFNMSPSPTTWDNTTIEFTNLSIPEPLVYFEWVFDTLNILGTSNLQSPTFTFPNNTAGTYTISLYVENINGCSDYITYDLHIYETLAIYIPNSFTPNDDGLNDLFKAYASNDQLKNFRMRIFDRYGEMVFESEDINFGWNGGFVNSDYFIKDDVYVYDVEVTSTITEEKLEYKGHITVIR
jgi:gliding motility-associated-like protein